MMIYWSRRAFTVKCVVSLRTADQGVEEKLEAREKRCQVCQSNTHMLSTFPKRKKKKNLQFHIYF